MHSKSQDSVRIKNGGVGEWLKPAVLKFARQYSHLVQISGLRYAVLHINGVFWAILAARCATGLLAPSLPCRVLLIRNPAAYATSNSMRICASSPELLRSR